MGDKEVHKHRRSDDNNDHLHNRIETVADELLQCKTEVGQQLERGAVKFDELEKKIDMYISRVEHLLSIFETAEGFFRVLGWIGIAVKWIAAIVAALTGVWYAIKHGVK